MKDNEIDYSKLPPECDPLCEFRQCLQKGKNEGPYVTGRGYTSRYTDPVYVCLSRMHNGCVSVKHLADNKGNPLSPIPDFGKMLETFDKQISDAKMTRKLRDMLKKQADCHKGMLEYLNAMTRYVEKNKEL